MKSFTDRVKRNQEGQGLHVFQVPKDMVPIMREPIDLICMKHGVTTFIRARGNGHGNLHTSTKLRLQVLGKQCGARVLYARVNGENAIVFERVYERRKKKRNYKKHGYGIRQLQTSLRKELKDIL